MTKKDENPFLNKRFRPLTPDELERALQKGVEDARELDKHIRDSFGVDPRRDDFLLD